MRQNFAQDTGKISQLGFGFNMSPNWVGLSRGKIFGLVPALLASLRPTSSSLVGLQSHGKSATDGFGLGHAITCTIHFGSR